MEREQFKHSIELRVRSYEVDWQGVVHNSNYLRYFETARIEYLRAIGWAVDRQTIVGESKVVLVRHEIDYRAAASFDDVLKVYTRTSSIGRSSFAMEGMIEDETTGRRIAETVSVHVWLEPASDRPQPVPEKFREKVRAFEKEAVSFQSPDPAGGA